jgi:large subunit ribosomal protein L32
MSRRTTTIESEGFSMGALPKQRVSRGRQRNRRRHHYLKLPQLMECPNCLQKKRTHYVCPNCGFYKGREVIQVKTGTPRTQAD